MSDKAIIPGGTGGIGSAVVNRLLKDDIRVVVPTRQDGVDLPDDPLLTVEHIDYTVSENVARLAEQHDDADSVIYCAGSFEGHKKVSDFSDADVVSKFESNIRTLWHFLRAFLPVLREQDRGNVIAISSLAAEQHKPYLGLSTFAKQGMEAILKTVDNEESINGVNANIVVPSIVNTEKERRIFPNDDTDYFLPREEIADIIHAACYEDTTRYLHGTRIRCYVPNPNRLQGRKEALEKRGVL